MEISLYCLGQCKAATNVPEGYMDTAEQAGKWERPDRFRNVSLEGLLRVLWRILFGLILLDGLLG